MRVSYFFKNVLFLYTSSHLLFLNKPFLSLALLFIVRNHLWVLLSLGVMLAGIIIIIIIVCVDQPTLIVPRQSIG